MKETLQTLFVKTDALFLEMLNKNFPSKCRVQDVEMSLNNDQVGPNWQPFPMYVF